MNERGLQALLTVLGVVAASVGAATLVWGGALVLNAGRVSPSMDSELRFHAAWYLAAGWALLWAARKIRERGFVVVWVAAAVLLAACSRVVSLVTVGTPHRLYVILMVIEFMLPGVLVGWLRAARRSWAQT